MLAPGTRIGPYEVTDQIGVGGMGEVYRAAGTTLGRQVAIKVLPAAVAMDTDRLARFDREARTLAALSHSNIAAIYGVEKSGGTTALVMELVEEPTYTAIALSPDARRAAVVKRNSTGSDLWLMDLQTARSERLTFTGTVASSQAVWSTDGQSIVFSDFGERRTRIFRKILASTTEAELLYTTPDSGYVTAFRWTGVCAVYGLRPQDSRCGPHRPSTARLRAGT